MVIHVKISFILIFSLFFLF